MTPEKEQKLQSACLEFANAIFNTYMNKRPKGAPSVQEMIEAFAKSPEVSEYHKQPPAESDGWISVKDQEPPSDCPILIKDKTTIYTGGAYIETGKVCLNRKTSFGSTVDCFDLEDFTHWQPLPAAPKPKT